MSGASNHYLNGEYQYEPLGQCFQKLNNSHPKLNYVIRHASIEDKTMWILSEAAHSQGTGELKWRNLFCQDSDETSPPINLPWVSLLAPGTVVPSIEYDRI